MTYDGGTTLGSTAGTSMTTGQLIFSLIICIIVIASVWKIFEKAGIAGWKALIPVYNIYLLYKIAKVDFWIWLFIPLIITSIISGILTTAETMPTIVVIIVFIASIICLVGSWKMARGLANAFGKGIGFTLGLFFISAIFYPILGFGSAKYVD